ncbi:uncharacterized protein LOC135842494 isoform X2 [Planococcus citri]|uniref:uncharacterized protein LOC135842494 isoform X2 n=1 Tax=Planococcus citri TaxID=170843 RepID=UPI0031F897C8
MFSLTAVAEMKRAFSTADCSALCSKLEELRLEHDRGIETRSSKGFGDRYDSVLAKLRGTPGEEIAPGLILRHVVDFIFNEFGVDLLDESRINDISTFGFCYKFREEWLKNEYLFSVMVIRDCLLDFNIAVARRYIGQPNSNEPKRKKASPIFAHVFVPSTKLPSFKASERDTDVEKFTALIEAIIGKCRKLWTLKQEWSQGSSDSESTSSSTDDEDDTSDEDEED